MFLQAQIKLEPNGKKYYVCIIKNTCYEKALYCNSVLVLHKSIACTIFQPAERDKQSIGFRLECRFEYFKRFLHELG